MLQAFGSPKKLASKPARLLKCNLPVHSFRPFLQFFAYFACFRTFWDVCFGPLLGGVRFRTSHFSALFACCQLAAAIEFPMIISHSQWAERDTLMSRRKKRRETIFVSQLSRSYPHRRGNFERKKCPFLWARDSFGGILGDNLGEGNCESKVVVRQWGVNFCRETSRCLAGPSGLPWVRNRTRENRPGEI